MANSITEFWQEKERQRSQFYNQKGKTPEELQKEASFFHNRLEGFILVEPSGKEFSVKTLKPINEK